MFDNISYHGIFVLDQDEALDFYVGKLGFEVSDDIDLGFMRWLTIHLPSAPDRHVLLEKPGPPSMSEEAAAEMRNLVTKGATGLAMILDTDDCQKTYDELVAKGVETTQEPTQQPYGIDCGIRDPFGNHIRVTQPAAQAGEITDQDKRRMAGERGA